MLALSSAADSAPRALVLRARSSVEHANYVLSRVLLSVFAGRSWWGFSSDPSSKEVESGRHGVQSHLWLPREFEIAWAMLANGLIT